MIMWAQQWSLGCRRVELGLVGHGVAGGNRSRVVSLYQIRRCRIRCYANSELWRGVGSVMRRKVHPWSIELFASGVCPFPTFGRSHLNRSLAMPDYSSQQYWSKRLLGEDMEGFEWLVGSEEILPLVSMLLDHRQGPARILHFGCGSSTLGPDLQRHFGERVRVYDADYAISGTERKFLAQQTGSDIHTLPLLHFDALDLQDMAGNAPLGGWDILVDKSTADAIACGEPLMSISRDGSGSATREPIEVLCENLNRVTSTDASWLCVSYSASRFDFLLGAEKQHGWRVQSKTPIRLSQSGNEGVVHRPETGIWAWVLRRL